jgi:endo-alpha-1,4-polygalactosaminidase (GH114 family)
LLGNGGLGMLPETAKALDAVAVESVFTDYQFQPASYRLRAEAGATSRAHDLSEQLKTTGLPVFVIEYVDPSRVGDALAVADRVRAEGWVPFVGTIGLDVVPTPPAKLTVGRNVPPPTP